MSPEAYRYCLSTVFNEPDDDLRAYLRQRLCELPKGGDTEESRAARRLFRISPELALLNEKMPLSKLSACFPEAHRDIECTIYKDAVRETSELVTALLSNKSLRPSGFIFFAMDSMVGVFKTRNACLAAETAFRNLDIATKRCRAFNDLGH